MFLTLNFIISCLCNLGYPANSLFTFIDILKSCHGYLFRLKFPGPRFQYLLSFQPGLIQGIHTVYPRIISHWSWKTHLTLFISDLRLQLDKSPARINWRLSGFCYPVNIIGTVSVPALGPFLCLLVLLQGFLASPGWLSVLGFLLSWPNKSKSSSNHTPKPN